MRFFSIFCYIEKLYLTFFLCPLLYKSDFLPQRILGIYYHFRIEFEVFVKLRIASFYLSFMCILKYIFLNFEGLFPS